MALAVLGWILPGCRAGAPHDLHGAPLAGHLAERVGEASNPGPHGEWDFDWAAVCQAAAVRPAKQFTGSVPGFVFTLRGGTLGYHADSRPPQPGASGAPEVLAYLVGVCGEAFAGAGAQLSLDACVPGPGSAWTRPRTLVLDELLAPGPELHCPGQRRRGRDRGHRPRRRGKRGVVTPLALEAAVSVEASDASFRQAGLWAFDTVNANSAATAVQYLEVSAADACMVQESRTLGDASRAAERGAKRAKWDMAVNDVVATDAGSTSAGVAIAARCHVGLGGGG